MNAGRDCRRMGGVPTPSLAITSQCPCPESAYGRHLAASAVNKDIKNKNTRVHLSPLTIEPICKTGICQTPCADKIDLLASSVGDFST